MEIPKMKDQDVFTGEGTEEGPDHKWAGVPRQEVQKFINSMRGQLIIAQTFSIALSEMRALEEAGVQYGQPSNRADMEFIHWAICSSVLVEVVKRTMEEEEDVSEDRNSR